jgi:transcriptional regulator of acetoin/glycerol metabolism
LQNYDFPGNVRELQNIVERSIIIFPNGAPDVSCLPHEALFGHKVPAHPLQDEGRYSADKETVYRLLLKHKGNISETAQEMGIALTTLYRKMDRYGFSKTIVQ